MSVTYDSSEQQEILHTFLGMLKAATEDGGIKRQAGLKPSWKVDPEHEQALFSHLAKWKRGELVDDHSGAHPLVHLAWRALAIAWQETNPSEVRAAKGTSYGEIQEAYERSLALPERKTRVIDR